MSTINPFGTSTDSPTIDVVPIKAFGCTVVDFNVSADWSSQAGNLSFKIIESDTDGDRLQIPVLGTPHLFELKDSNSNVLFQYIGLVDSFSRSSINSKIYSVSLSSPLKILDATNVILDKFVGLGGSIEGSSNFGATTAYNFGHRNSSIDTVNSPGVNHWWNVSNLINAYGILENDDPLYKVPFFQSIIVTNNLYGDFGFSANSDSGMPLIKLMWALHMGINHLPTISGNQRQRTHGGNLLFGRHNYNVIADAEGIPYYYHVDILGFYNQVKDLIGPQFRIGGSSKTLREIINEICQEANLEYFCYIDLYSDVNIGAQTLQENDPNWTKAANCSWTGLNTGKFHIGGNYGGTIRIQTVNKNVFFNANRPFSNIAFNLIGLEVPDLKDAYWTSQSGIHPGKRPVNDTSYGTSVSTVYSDPLDSRGLDADIYGFTDVGTNAIASGGYFPVATDYWDSGKLSDLKLKSSDVSLKMNDATTMKVVVGGYQTRIISVSRDYFKHYWGDIILPNGSDPRETADTETDSLGLDETSSRKIPVVTPLLDPRDIDDFILIDMKSIFGSINISGVLYNGVYAASLYEIRIAMGGGKDSFEKWLAFMEKFKNEKLLALREYFFPNCINTNHNSSKDAVEATKNHNNTGGLGYNGVSASIRTHYTPTPTTQQTVRVSRDGNDNVKNKPSTVAQSGVECFVAEYHIINSLLPNLHEKVKDIGDTHYGKSWYVPVPYFKTKRDLDGDNLVGNFERSWELTDSAYVEPSNYYAARIPQSNQFVNNGKVSPFVNYDHNFVFTGGNFDEAYAADLTSNITGKTNQVFNFSEYSLDELSITKYSSTNIIHAAPASVDGKYSFLPYAYETYYNRALIPYFDVNTKIKKYYSSNKTGDVSPREEGQAGNKQTTSDDPKLNKNWGYNNPPLSSHSASLYDYSSNLLGPLTNPKQLPKHTAPSFLSSAVSNLSSLSYADDGIFQFAFVKVETKRVILPQIEESYGDIIGFTKANIVDELNFDDVTLNTPFAGTRRAIAQHKVTDDVIQNTMTPFSIAIPPKSINYAQISNRHVYGPWITSLNSISFRGKIEYEQDDSLVPENFLIPTNFGQFGDFTLSQTSGLAGLNLAAQGRANAIDNFGLFALEEGSFTIPGAPSIKRIGETLYGLQQVTDIRISMSNNNVETTYTFKTISPRFGKNNRDIEKNLTTISNKLKKIKLR